jgi:hypothetical protein
MAGGTKIEWLLDDLCGNLGFSQQPVIDRHIAAPRSAEEVLASARALQWQDSA